MTINKGEPWAFWPSHLCDTFPEEPGNKLLTGEHNWEIQLELSLPIIREDERQSILTLLPHYTSFEVQGENIYLAYTGASGETYYKVVKYPLESGKRYRFTWLHRVGAGLLCVLEDIQLWEFGFKDDPLASPNEPHVIFGAGNFPKNGFNLNYTEVDLYSFKLWSNKKLVAYTRFDEIIFDKAVDLTGNCNFINRI